MKVAIYLHKLCISKHQKKSKHIIRLDLVWELSYTFLIFYHK